MAELTFKSAGVSTREIDLSGPTPQQPQGVPAGVIGTSTAGPAFVPLTFGSFTDFRNLFGQTDGKKFGPLAVNEWMKSAKAGTFIRVLGVGDGKKRDSSTGIVTNAGFVVGGETVQSNGFLGANPFANGYYSGVAAKLVLTIGNGSDTTVPAASDQFTITAGDGTNTDLTMVIKFNSSGNNETAFQTLGGTRDADLEIDIDIEDDPTKIATAISTALTGLVSSAVNDVDLSNYTVSLDTSNANACTITLTATTNIATTYNLTYAESGGSNVDTNSVLAGALTSGVTPINSPEGRTYFLGTYMSESAGSTIFSDAGLQVNDVKATGTITIGNSETGTDCTSTHTVTITDHTGLETVYEFLNNADSAAGSNVKVSDGAGAIASAQNLDIANALKTAIEATQGISVEIGASPNQHVLTLTQNVIGSGGNNVITSVGSTVTAKTGFTGGQGGARPILRGVLLAPSGVILHLSGNNMADPDAPGYTDTALAASGDLMGRKGGITGSVDLASQEFVMLMNGFKGSVNKPTTLTASFDMTSPNYFPNVFNTDPLQIEEKGHLLYGHYDIYPAMAKVTGSGVVTAGGEIGNKLDIGFLLTGSAERGQASSDTEADYEDFQDRFTHAESPFVTSQGFDSPSGYDLFKFVALDSGESGAGKYKISIENLRPTTNGYGRFDVLIRRFDDVDEERKVLESHRGLSLDPGSERYIGRAIGDQHVFFNFDNDLESQKIIVDGVHPVRSRYVRVELSDMLKKKEVPVEALPFGFRGPVHLNTSGSLLSSEDSATYVASESVVSNVVEPPFPLRSKISNGVDLNKTINTRLYWGMQSAQIIDPADPNKNSSFNDTIKTIGKHFPKHRKTVVPFAIGNNAGAADLAGGTVLDSDRFNNNRFSLENIKVVTGSNAKAMPTKWIDAEYVRNGVIAADATTKTRRFKVSDLSIVSNRKFAKFTLPMQGGFDGVNIFDKDKKELLNTAVKREMDDAEQGELKGPTVSAYRKAVDVMGSKSDTEIQLLAIPGIRHPSVTDYAISAVESRFDAMYIMDIEERDTVNNVITSSDQNPHVLYTVNDFKNRALDSSFAAAYFPDLTVVDPGTGALVQTPPSVAVLGAYSNNDLIGHPWTAPAGFSRGALSAVESSSVLLNRDNLDDLYDADINPITAFPGTGITVWGQKTVLQAASALDRVNVRRLLIDIRRKVRNIANTLLFEPNRAETLEKFSALVNPVLQRVQAQSGVDRYKVIIDTTTTTQADVENNTIRGKIFLQPTRTVEFVALDFVVTNAGSELL